MAHRMNLPTPFTIGVRKATEGTRDAHGVSTKGFAPAVDVEVYSIAPRASDEPFERGRNAVVTGLTVLAPVGTDVGPKDRVVIDNEEYEVEGDIADWSRGPFGWAPGIEIHLKRVEG